MPRSERKVSNWYDLILGLLSITKKVGNPSRQKMEVMKVMIAPGVTSRTKQTSSHLE